MNITLTSLEALVLKATNESLPRGQPEQPAIAAFWAIATSSPEGPQLAAQALAGRIHSRNPREALLALAMLDQCMRKGDKSFLAEISKFRFLNELIKLVSPKYLADRTASEVKMRVLQLIHAWSNEYPKETKFKVAYDMLRNQGVIVVTPPPIQREDAEQPKARIKSAIFEDEEKSKLLQKLLQSKKPEDLQHANRLIKSMVREEEQRSEVNSRHAQEVSAALDSAGLLRDMLEHASSASVEEEQLIHELHASCVRLRPVLQRLAASDDMADNLDDILHASDVLDEVFELYSIFTSDKTSKKLASLDAEQATNGDSLLDFAGNTERNSKVNAKNALDELGDIFSAEPSSCHVLEPLKPENMICKSPSEESAKSPMAAGSSSALEALDCLSEQLLKQSLPQHARREDAFNGKTKKIPMNALEKTSPKQELPNDAILDLDFFTRKLDTESVQPTKTCEQKPNLLDTDDVMVDISENTNGVDNLVSRVTLNESSEVKKVQVKIEEVKPLTDINLTLDSVKPSKVAPIVAFYEDDGISVTLHFCMNRPRPDVNVIVVSTTSKKEMLIEDYKFQTVVPKSCKARLLPPSGSSLAPYNPFLPPPALTQLLLLGVPRPAVGGVDLKFVITYSCDGETCSDIGEVKALPLDDI